MFRTPKESLFKCIAIGNTRCKPLAFGMILLILLAFFIAFFSLSIFRSLFLCHVCSTFVRRSSKLVLISSSPTEMLLLLDTAADIKKEDASVSLPVCFFSVSVIDLSFLLFPFFSLSTMSLSFLAALAIAGGWVKASKERSGILINAAPTAAAEGLRIDDREVDRNVQRPVYQSMNMQTHKKKR